MPGPLGPPEAATESRVGTAGSVTGRPVPNGFALSARQLITATGLAVLLAAAAPHAANDRVRPAEPTVGAAAAARSPGASLPLSARLAASGALGGSDRSYSATSAGREAIARNPSQRFEIRFKPSAATIRAGSLWLSLSLRAVHTSSAQLAFGSAAPSARANRVRYARTRLEEWYL